MVLDLGQPAAGIQKLLHGAGSWDEGHPVADTLGQFLLCSAALHHALHAFEDEPILDDAQGFNLAPQAAAWLFPRLKAWAGPHYGAWECGLRQCLKHSVKSLFIAPKTPAHAPAHHP